MPAWIHDRAEHIRKKNPSMPKSQAFAIATQQSHATGHTPKGYGTAEGRREAKRKYDDPPKSYTQTADPSSKSKTSSLAFLKGSSTDHHGDTQMKNKLAGHLPLQDAIARTIEEAREKMKLAAESADGDKEKVKKLLKFEKKEHGHVPSVEEEKAEYEKKSSVIDPADPEEVEKLASALDFAAEKIAGDSVTTGGESRQGGEVLPTARPVGGLQPYKKDSSKAHNVPTSTGMKATKDNPGAATAVPTDDERAPGGNGAKYPAKGVLKTGAAKLRETLSKMAFSVTDEGHKLDAKRYGAQAKMHGEMANAERDYADQAPVKAHMFRGTTGLLHKIQGRHLDYAARKHEKGQNALNPFGGMATPARHEKTKKSFAVTDEGHKLDAKRYGAISRAHGAMADAEREYADTAPVKAHLFRGTTGLLHRITSRNADYAAAKHEKGQNALNPFGGWGTPARHEKKTKKSAAEAVDYILGKIATVENGGEKKQGGEQLSNTAPVPSNPGRNLIASNAAPASATKREAKAPRKKELAEVLTEPAFSKAHDSKVHENLRNAAKGGVKIAAARAFLQKIAEEGCQCDGAGTCRCCKMEKLKKETTKASA